MRCFHIEISLISVKFFAGKTVIDLTMQGLNKKVNLERELSFHFKCTIVRCTKNLAWFLLEEATTPTL